MNSPSILLTTIKKSLLAFLLSILVGVPAFAQNEVLLPFLEEIPQATYRSPVARPQAKLSIGIPIISSLGLGYRNSAFSLQDISYAKGDSTILDPNKMLDKMASGSNYLYFSNTTDLFHVGWKHKTTWWMINVSDNLESHISLPKDLATVAWKGNLGFAREGKTADFSTLNLKVTHYREIGLLMQWELNEEMLLGVKPKVLFGLSNAELTKSDLSLYTDTANPFTLSAKTNFELRTSTGPYETTGNYSGSGIGNQFMNYYLNFRNPGLGADVGFRYTPKETKWDFSGALTNFGFIYWTTNTKTYAGSSNPISYRGLTYSGLTRNDQIISVSNLGDSIRNAVGYTEATNAYVSTITAQTTLQGQYHLTDWVSLGAAVNGWVFQGIKAAAQVNALIKYNRIVGLGTSYTIQNGRFDNIGLGVYLKPGPLQLYMVSDNVMGLIKPSTTYNTNVRVGLNLLFGGPKDTDKDGIIDEKDNCPDQPGLRKFKGCPDRDNDGIIDSEDNCPSDSGLAIYNGCPDRDGDGIIDKEDKCPKVPGIAALKGCPDRDNDGITDLEDVCPDSAGLAYLKGCPDFDLDSVPNYLDKCPTVKGPQNNDGCPIPEPEKIEKVQDIKESALPVLDEDTDKDGIPNLTDACPALAGPATNKGCPVIDSDGDGITDDEDACPKTAGLRSNKGCPELKAEQKAIVKKAFSNLEFDFNKATIRAKSLPSLKALAKLLAEVPTIKLELSGHTDNAGNPKANLDLSKRRTLSVQSFLLKSGAKSEQVTSLWFGDKKPIASNKTPQGRTKNRRVEMKLQYE